jgi:integrase
MAGTVRHARLESASARDRLKRGRQPHWQALVEGKVHLGYQRKRGAADGRWVLRRYVGNGKYRVEPLGRADDAAHADGRRVLSYDQAEAKARAMVGVPGESGKIARMTVRQAVEHYVEFKRAQGQPIGDLISRTKAHVLPELGNLVVAELTAERLRRWLATMAAAPAQKRPKAGKPQYRAEPEDGEAKRRRQASANRVLTMLKAALNHAFDEGHIKNRDAWGRKLKPFHNVEVARVRYLSVAEAQRLMNACDPEFRPLVQAALQTGCRYSELARLEVQDFNADAGKVAIRRSKSGKARHVVLTDEGTEFFTRFCAGRGGHELMFRQADGGTWQKSAQARPMREAVTRARITPPISFHGLRHTWASHAVMNGVPLLVVAKNLGHRDTRMVERHYGHLAPSFVTEAIRASAPRFGGEAAARVVPMHRPRRGSSRP